MLRAIWPLTGRGVCVLLLGIALVLTARLIEVPVLVALAMAFIALPLLAVLALWVRRPVQLLSRRISNDVVPAGFDIHLTAEVRITGFGLGPVTWRQRAETGAAHDDLALSPDRRGGLQAVIPTSRRGMLRVPPTLVTVVDALGLARRTVPIGEDIEIAVGPAMAALPVSRRAPESLGDITSSVSFTGTGSDDLLVRPYAPGDSIRRVHWGATAHHGDLMVRQEEAEASPHATIVLALTAAGTFSADDPAQHSLELALSAAASIAYRIVGDDAVVTVRDAHGALVCPRIVEPADFGSLLAALATFAPADTEAAIAPGTVPAGAVLVLCGTDAGAVTAQLRDALPRRGAAVSVITCGGPGAVQGASGTGWPVIPLAGDMPQAALDVWDRLRTVQHG